MNKRSAETQTVWLKIPDQQGKRIRPWALVEIQPNDKVKFKPRTTGDKVLAIFPKGSPFSKTGGLEIILDAKDSTAKRRGSKFAFWCLVITKDGEVHLGEPHDPLQDRAASPLRGTPARVEPVG